MPKKIHQIEGPIPESFRERLLPMRSERKTSRIRRRYWRVPKGLVRAWWVRERVSRIEIMISINPEKF